MSFGGILTKSCPLEISPSIELVRASDEESSALFESFLERGMREDEWSPLPSLAPDACGLRRPGLKTRAADDEVAGRSTVLDMGDVDT